MSVVGEKHQVIDGVTYTTTTFPAGRALDVLQQILALIPDKAVQLVLDLEDDAVERLFGGTWGKEQAPTAAGAAEGGEAETEGDDESDGFLGIMLFNIGRAIASNAAPGAFSALALELLRNTQAHPVQIGAAQGIGNVATHFDTHFAGRLDHLLRVCVWVARAGFGGP